MPKFIAEVENDGLTIKLHLKYPQNVCNGKYVVCIEEISKKRSLSQNNYLWDIIGEISKVEYGDMSGKDEIYANLLEMAGVKATIVDVVKDAIPTLKKAVKGIVREISSHTKDGTEFVTCQVFYGSSQMTTKEFSMLLDTALNYASNIGINIEYWKEVM